MHQDLKCREGQSEIGVVSVSDRDLFCMGQSSVCVMSG